RCSATRPRSAARPISTPASSTAGARVPCSAIAATAAATASGSRPHWYSFGARASAPLPRPARFPRFDGAGSDGFEQTTSDLPGHGDSDGPLLPETRRLPDLLPGRIGQGLTHTAPP